MLHWLVVAFWGLNLLTILLRFIQQVDFPAYLEGLLTGKFSGSVKSSFKRSLCVPNFSGVRNRSATAPMPFVNQMQTVDRNYYRDIDNSNFSDCNAEKNPCLNFNSESDGTDNDTYL